MTVLLLTVVTIVLALPAIQPECGRWCRLQCGSSCTAEAAPGAGGGEPPACCQATEAAQLRAACTCRHEAARGVPDALVQERVEGKTAGSGTLASMLLCWLDVRSFDPAAEASLAPPGSGLARSDRLLSLLGVWLK